jgi:hypothetical protein
MKTINLKTISDFMSEKEMKKIKGGLDENDNAADFPEEPGGGVIDGGTLPEVTVWSTIPCVPKYGICYNKNRGDICDFVRQSPTGQYWRITGTCVGYGDVDAIFVGSSGLTCWQNHSEPCS